MPHRMSPHPVGQRILDRRAGMQGMALMACVYNQAHKFGVETAVPNEVIGFEEEEAKPPALNIRRE